MRIVIDLQGAQASNARRGIGRYSLALAQGIARQATGRHEVLVALNGGFTDSIEPLRAAFRGLLPDDAIRVWHAPLTPGQAPGFGLRRAAERVREAFLAALQPDIVHVSSLFEGPHDGAVTSCGSFAAASFPTSVTLYDLIPLLRPGSYLTDPAARAEYLGRIEHLVRADLLLAVTVPDDAVMHVGIDAYLTHLTLIEVLTVLVAQRLGEPAVQRLRSVREALHRQGIDVRTHPVQSWDGRGVYRG